MGEVSVTDMNGIQGVLLIGKGYSEHGGSEEVGKWGEQSASNMAIECYNAGFQAIVPESNSFQMPQSEMNVTSGCPQFIKHAIHN